MMRSISSYGHTLKWYLKAGPSKLFLAFAGRFRPVRALVVKWYKFSTNPSAQTPVDPSVRLIEAIDVKEVARVLDRDGLYSDILLQREVPRELRGTLLGLHCYGDGRKEFPFLYQDRHEAERRHHRTFTLGHYYDLVNSCPVVDQLSRDPMILQLAREYFGTTPMLIGLRAWWSFACGGSSEGLSRAGQAFHYDIDDYRALSFFFYLTDVDEASGPHICIRGSHRRKKLRHVWWPLRSRTDAELARFYKSDQIVRLCGPAGFGFAEDTFCFHKGSKPDARDRLVLQLRYAIRCNRGASDEMSADWRSP
jgi:hypothetical protein